MSIKGNRDQLDGFLITKSVQQWLTENELEDEIEINQEEKRSTYQMSYDLNEHEHQVYFEVDEEKNLFSIYIYNHLTVSKSSFTKVLEKINEINDEIPMGRLRVSEGKVFQYMQAMYLDDGVLTTKMIDGMFSLGINVFKKNNDELTKLVDESNLIIEVEDLSDTLTWDDIDGHEKLKLWSNKLLAGKKKILTKEDWELIGYGVVIVNSDTEYVKKVIKAIAKYAQYDFAFVKKDDLSSIFNSIVLKRQSPLIIYLEPGYWSLDLEKVDFISDEDCKNYEELVSGVIQLFQEFDVSQPIILITSSGSLLNISKSLRVKGCFDLYLSLADLPLEVLGKEFIQIVGDGICADSMKSNYGKIGHLIKGHTERWNNLASLSLRRIYHDQKRLVEYMDFVDADLHYFIEEGIVQESDEKIRFQTAYHEAGHAIMIILQYDGRNVPDYTSIMPGASGFAGITLESNAFRAKKSLGQYTFSDLKKDIRINLAGRAAEEILGGPEYVSTGASNDLSEATSLADRYFAYFGFNPEMDKPEKSGANLRTILNEKLTQTESSHIELLTRQFLEREYAETIKILNENNKLLKDIAEALMKDPVMSQEEISEICIMHNVKIIQNN